MAFLVHYISLRITYLDGYSKLTSLSSIAPRQVAGAAAPPWPLPLPLTLPPSSPLPGADDRASFHRGFRRISSKTLSAAPTACVCRGNSNGNVNGNRGVTTQYVCVCVFSSHSFWTSSSLDVPAGVTQEENHTEFLIHLLSAVRVLIFLARRIQPFLSLVDRQVEFCVLTI